MLVKFKGLLQWGALLLTTLAILAWRRPDQFFHPYIWVEEGTVTLIDYIHHGWVSLFYPVAGYLVLPSKLIFLTAISISFKHLPNIEYWLTVVFTGAVIFTIAHAPTVLKHRYLCALLVLVLPINSEVYAVSEYAFWWGTLLAFLVLLWNTEDTAHRPIRILLLILGGFSSPMILPISAMLGVRALVLRTRTDFILGILGFAIAAIQAYIMHIASAHSALPNFDIGLILEKFFGYFSYQPNADNILCAMLGELMLLVIITFFFMKERWRKLDSWLIIACLSMAIVASVTRVSINAIHPALAGPRYFFYPFIFLGWILLWMISDGNITQKIISCICLIGAVIVFVQIGQRHSDRMDWSANVRQCEKLDSFSMPIQFDGHKNLAWHVTISGSDCRRLSGDPVNEKE